MTATRTVPPEGGSTINSAAEAPSALGDRELKVIIRPHRLDFWEYQGTRAQLEAEGVIPADTEWPEGTQTRRWEDGRFRWGLRRTRPEGLKGPMKLWTSGDWWVLRCDLINGPDVRMRRILDKKRELEQEIYWASPAGQREIYRYCDAGGDKDFQHFKTLIPGLIPPKRGRKPKAAPAGAAADGAE